MIKKSILVMALAATLLLSAFSLANNADAFIQPNSSSRIKVIGPATCETPTGGDCGVGLLKSKIQLLEQEADENSASGIGKVKSIFKLGGQEGEDFKSKSLSFVHDFNGNKIAISGPTKASNGSTWQLEMKVINIDFVENTGDCSLKYSNSNGVVIEQPAAPCGVVLLPIDR